MAYAVFTNISFIYFLSLATHGQMQNRLYAVSGNIRAFGCLLALAMQGKMQ